jgi:hypothetical protein
MIRHITSKPGSLNYQNILNNYKDTPISLFHRELSNKTHHPADEIQHAGIVAKELF